MGSLLIAQKKILFGQMEREGFLRYDLVSTDTDNGRTKWFSFLDTG